jgi:threonine/homoserine/homoserine lactone efflux protein
VLTILATPGPTNTLLATSGAMIGLRHSLILIPAETAGYLASILTVGLAAGPFAASQPIVARTLQVAVGVYLLWVAWRLWRRGTALAPSGRLVTPGQVFMTTLLNPKALIFALGVVPFGAAPVGPYLAGFVLLLVTVAALWIAGGAMLARAAVAGGSHPGIVPRAGAVVVAGFALLLITRPLVG